MQAKPHDQRRGEPPRMLFLRRYGSYSGGHGKYIEYLSHALAHGRFRPVLHVAPDSPDPAGLEQLLPPGLPRIGLPAPCEAIFVAGTDWDMLDAAGQDCTAVPVINLVQHVRHADPAQKLHSYLSRPALRICVGPEVGKAVRTAGANGPVHVIENGIDIPSLEALREQSPPPENRPTGLLVIGLKAPDLARETAAALEGLGLSCDVITRKMPRADFLSRLAQARHALLLPNETEGYYLPALEAMALDTAVIMPDCIGARGFAVDGETCRIAPRTAPALAEAAAALIADPALSAGLRARGLETARRRTLAAERRAAFAIFDQIALSS